MRSCSHLAQEKSVCAATFSFLKAWAQVYTWCAGAQVYTWCAGFWRVLWNCRSVAAAKPLTALTPLYYCELQLQHCEMHLCESPLAIAPRVTCRVQQMHKCEICDISRLPLVARSLPQVAGQGLHSPLGSPSLTGRQV